MHVRLANRAPLSTIPLPLVKLMRPSKIFGFEGLLNTALETFVISRFEAQEGGHAPHRSSISPIKEAGLHSPTKKVCRGNHILTKLRRGHVLTRNGRILRGKREKKGGRRIARTALHTAG